MKQIPHLTYAEQFALDEWLFDYPETMSYEDILLTMKTGDEQNQITVWSAMNRNPMRHVADYIDDTRLHFERVVGSAFHE
jgi:hypothetical protein